MGEVRVLELLFASLAHSMLQRGIAEVGKELEGIGLVILLSHKEQRGFRGEQQQRGGKHAGAMRDKSGQALAHGTITYLIVILNTDHVRRRRHVGAAGAARTSVPEAEGLALKDKAVARRASNLLWPAKILVIAFALAGKEGVDGVMEIVTPDGVEAIAAGSGGANYVRIILVGFSDDTHLAAEISGQRGDIGLDFRQDVPGRIVVDGLDGIEPQAIHVIFAHPVEGILNKVPAHS